jgi:hypothetical protein
VYCVVPPRLARIRERLCEHFAADPRVEVVIDQRLGERRSDLADRLSPGLQRRHRDGRRVARPAADRVPPLPPELRRYEKHLTFMVAPREAQRPQETISEWRRRCAAAEAEALELCQNLIDLTEHLRERHGLHPMRYRALLRAEAAIERFRRGSLSRRASGAEPRADG